MSTERERFAAAQADRLAALQQEAADRPAHARYLAALLQTGTDRYVTLAAVEIPSGVSQAVAEALIDDVMWCRSEPPPPGNVCSPYANAYGRRRTDAARRAAKRRRTHDAPGSPLEALLSFEELPP